ncbi:MAG: MoaD/ThiS family protein [Chloroflexi bacterium]|nr:MoaD/ThiS family protein [Chloroflexota bacterium]MDA1002900.1 MoaD/ThiS family protein [Chloroflexota bacterium]MQC27679.1 molybdopterin synthase sulfur carrier subunit [Chloroflexota bacterium]
MVVVHIPMQWRKEIGVERLEVAGATLRQVIAALDACSPGIADRIMAEGRLRPELAISINGAIAERGLVEPVPEGAELYLIPAIGGG